MATSNPVELYVEDVTQCPICKDDLSDPRSPPCFHTFCLKCLKGHCRGRGPGDEAKCPLCRQEFIIPEGGIDDIKRNFTINGLVTARKEAAATKTYDKSDANLTSSTNQTQQQQLTTTVAAAVTTTTTTTQNKSLKHRLTTFIGRKQPAVTETSPQTDYQAILANNYRLISRSLVVTDLLLAHLRTSQYLKQKLGDIHKQAAADKVNKLQTILSNVPLKHVETVFKQLLFALRQDGQDHVANMFIPETDARPMSEVNHQLLLNKQEQLCKWLDPLSELINQLVDQKVFSDEDRNSVQNKPGYEEKSREMISILCHKSDSAFTTFINALTNTGQEHVAYILTGAGEPPMSDLRLEILKVHREKINDRLDSKETPVLIHKLVANGVLNYADRNNIESQTTGASQHAAILKSLQRKSNSAFDKFLQALNETGQKQIADILHGFEINGVLGTNFDSETPTSLQNKIVHLVRHNVEALVCDKENLSKIIELMQQNGFEVSRVAEGSILISFRCFTEESLVNLIRLYTDKTLDKLFTQVFCPEFTEQGLESLALRITNDEFERCLETFRQITLMTDEHRETLLQVAETESDMISVTDDLLSKLSFGDHHRKVVLSAGECHKVATLFGIISRQPDRLFTQLINALRETGQNEAADYIDNNKGESRDSLVGKFRVHSRIRSVSTKSDASFSCLPVEMLELVLMRTFIKLFTDHYKSQFKTHEAIELVYSSLAAVCYNWWQTMNGWEQSTTRHWFRHKLSRPINYVCRPYTVYPRLQFSRPMSGSVSGVTQCDNKLFVTCFQSNTIHVFGPNSQQLPNIELEQFNSPTDIVSCPETQQLYVSGMSRDSTGCVWRVSLDGRQVVKWLPNKSTTTSQFRPYTLSLTSRRLLVTSQDNKELLLYGADDVELKRVPLPDMDWVQHAVETSHGTFIFSHSKPQPRVCEVDVDGHVIHVYNNRQQLTQPVYLSLDSGGRIFVVDNIRHHILLLNSELELERILLDKQQHSLTAFPGRLCYTEQTHQLAVGGSEWDESRDQWLPYCVQLFTVR